MTVTRAVMYVSRGDKSSWSPQHCRVRTGYLTTNSQDIGAAEEPETHSVPANQGLRAHDDPCGAPCEQPGQQRQAYPRRAIDSPRLQGPLHVQGQLPAQESTLRIPRLAGPKCNSHPTDQVGY